MSFTVSGYISSNSFIVRSSLPQSFYPILVIMDLPGQFPGHGFGYDNGFPGAPPMGSFHNYQYTPFMPQSSATPLSTNDPNNAPPFAQNVQTIPTAGHPYHQTYGMDPRQPFSMPGYIPASPHSSTIPSGPYHVPIQNLNPHQRVALAEQFAKSSNAPGAAVPPNVAGYSPAPEHLTPGSRPQGIPSDGLATTSTLSDIPPNQPAPSVQKPVRKESNSLDFPYRSRGVRKFAGHLSSKWLENVQQITKYKFRDPDILEEALESPGSGIRFVGNTHRDISDWGNKRLATVGTRIMESVLTTDCYNAGIPKSKPPCRPSI